VWTTFTEYSASCSGSFYDVITGVSGATLLPASVMDCATNPSWVNAYEDQYWNFDIFAALAPEVAEMGWYAGTVWYVAGLLGEYDPLAYVNWKKMVENQINQRTSGTAPSDGAPAL
jgi:hypothetical protein